MSTIFYLASVVLSLYAAYLFAFKTYDCDYDGKPTKRMVCQNVIYLLVLVLTFLPIANVILVVFATTAGVMNVYCKYIYIDSWLFRKPKEEKEDWLWQGNGIGSYTSIRCSVCSMFCQSSPLNTLNMAITNGDFL